MATVSTLPLVTSLPMKFFSFDPSARKRKTNSKPKPKKSNITEHKLYDDDSHGYDGEWANIDDFSSSLSDSNALRSLDPGLLAIIGATGLSGSLYPDGEGELRNTPPPQIPQSQQPGQEGSCPTTDVEQMDIDELFDGSSPEIPVVLNDDAARASHDIDNIQSSHRQRECQDDDLDAAGMRTFSMENMTALYNDGFPEQDAPYGNVSMRHWSSATRKRNNASSADTIISSAEVLNPTSKPASEDSRSPKQLSGQSQVESLASSPVCTPSSTTMPPPPSQDRGSRFPPFRVSNDPDVVETEGGGNDEHSNDVIEKELLHSLRQTISPSERREGDKDFSSESEKGDNQNDASDSEVGESRDDEPRQADDMSATTSRRHKLSNRRIRKKARGKSQTAFRPRDRSTMRTRTSQQLIPSHSQHLPPPRTDRVARSGSPQTSSPRATAVDEPNVSYGLSATTAYQIANVTIHPMPRALSIVTATVHCNGSKLPLDLIALDTSILGERGQVIRMTQVSQDSWSLLGYRDDENASISRTHRSWTVLSADQKSNSYSDDDHPDNYMGEEDEDEDADKDTTECRRTRIPWLPSDDQRLIAYNKMNMKWKEIFERFPDRTPGAVRTRSHTLQRR